MLQDIAFFNKSQKINIAYEIPFFNKDDDIYYNTNSFLDNFKIRFKKALNVKSDILSIKFNLSLKDFESQFNLVKKATTIINENTDKPLILRGMNNESYDIDLLNFLAQNIKKESIIAFAQESNYRDIIPTIIKTAHKIVLRTPIDINLAKELNILSINMGLPKDRIIIDTDTGGLGYGFDYGYSMMEKVKLEALKGDEMLNFPIISFIGEEVFKAKELKSNSFDENWGKLNNRIDLWEITAATSIIAANANIVVVWNINTVNTLNEVIKN